MAVKNSRPLELAADAELRDAPFRQLGELDFLAFEVNGARGGFRFAGDDVHERRLAGAVRADDAAQLALVDGERQVVEREEPVEVDGDVVDPQHELALGEDDVAIGPRFRVERDGGKGRRDHHRHDRRAESRALAAAPMPMRPSGTKRVTTTKSTPST